MKNILDKTYKGVVGKKLLSKYSAVYRQQQWALFFPLPQQKRVL